MTRQLKLTVLVLASMLIIIVATPPTAHAGFLKIYNKNCTKTAHWSTKKRVTVNVYSKKGYDGCKKVYISVPTGQSKTLEIRAQSYNGENCGKYRHEAAGTIEGKYDVRGDRDSYVTCKKDWLGVCQCTKTCEGRLCWR